MLKILSYAQKNLFLHINEETLALSHLRSKEPPIFNFPTLDSAKYFYKMATAAGPSCGEMGLNSQNKNCRVSLEYTTK